MVPPMIMLSCCHVVVSSSPPPVGGREPRCLARIPPPPQLNRSWLGAWKWPCPQSRRIRGLIRGGVPGGHWGGPKQPRPHPLFWACFWGGYGAVMSLIRRGRGVVAGGYCPNITRDTHPGGWARSAPPYPPSPRGPRHPAWRARPVQHRGQRRRGGEPGGGVVAAQGLNPPSPGVGPFPPRRPGPPVGAGLGGAGGRGAPGGPARQRMAAGG